MPPYFYSTREPFGKFSNFSACGIEIDGQWWPTTEHYFQAQKFDDAAYRKKIRGPLRRNRRRNGDEAAPFPCGRIVRP